MNERLKGIPWDLEGLEFGPNNPLTPEVIAHITPVQVAVLFQQLVEEPEILGGLVTPDLVEKLKTGRRTTEALKEATVALFGGLSDERIEDLAYGLCERGIREISGEVLDGEKGLCLVPEIYLNGELQRRQRLPE